MTPEALIATKFLTVALFFVLGLFGVGMFWGRLKI